MKKLFVLSLMFVLVMGLTLTVSARDDFGTAETLDVTATVAKYAEFRGLDGAALNLNFNQDEVAKSDPDNGYDGIKGSGWLHFEFVANCDVVVTTHGAELINEDGQRIKTTTVLNDVYNKDRKVINYADGTWENMYGWAHSNVRTTIGYEAAPRPLSLKVVSSLGDVFEQKAGTYTGEVLLTLESKN